MIHCFQFTSNSKPFKPYKPFLPDQFWEEFVIFGVNISLNKEKQVYAGALAKNEGLAKPRCFILPDKIDRKCS